MAEFAHIVDFRLPGIQKLSPLPEIISYYRSIPDKYSKLHQLVEKVSRGVFWDEDLQDEYDSKFLPLRRAAFTSAFESLTQDTQLHYRGSGGSKSVGKEYSS